MKSLYSKVIIINLKASWLHEEKLGPSLERLQLFLSEGNFSYLETSWAKPGTWQLPLSWSQFVPESATLLIQKVFQSWTRIYLPHLSEILFFILAPKGAPPNLSSSVNYDGSLVVINSLVHATKDSDKCISSSRPPNWITLSVT